MELNSKEHKIPYATLEINSVFSFVFYPVSGIP